MGVCAAGFIAANRTRHICQLDAGHEGACAGPMDPEVRRAARRGARARHAQMEASQRQERAMAPQAPGASMSPAAFAALLLSVATAGRATYAEALAEIMRRLGSPDGLMVNGRPAGIREVRQVAHRLQRDGQLIIDGDVLVA